MEKEMCEFCGKEDMNIDFDRPIKCNLGFQHYPCEKCRKRLIKK
jgi:hypothetical protein